MVRAFAHGAMGRRIDPSCGAPIELFLAPVSDPTSGVTKADRSESSDASYCWVMRRGMSRVVTIAIITPPTPRL